MLTFGLQIALLGRPDFPLPLPGLVHVANRLELRRPSGSANRSTSQCAPPTCVRTGAGSRSTCRARSPSPGSGVVGVQQRPGEGRRLSGGEERVERSTGIP